MSVQLSLELWGALTDFSFFGCIDIGGCGVNPAPFFPAESCFLRFPCGLNPLVLGCGNFGFRRPGVPIIMVECFPAFKPFAVGSMHGAQTGKGRDA